MSLYKDFLALGYTDSEALELTHLAEDFEDGSVADIEPDEATKIIIGNGEKQMQCRGDVSFLCG